MNNLVKEGVAREKGRDLTQSYDKSSYTDRKSKKRRDDTKTPPKTSITTVTIAERLRTVSWGNDSHQTGVVKIVNGIPTLIITTTVV